MEAVALGAGHVAVDGDFVQQRHESRVSGQMALKQLSAFFSKRRARRKKVLKNTK